MSDIKSNGQKKVNPIVEHMGKLLHGHITAIVVEKQAPGA